MWGWSAGPAWASPLTFFGALGAIVAGARRAHLDVFALVRPDLTLDDVAALAGGVLEEPPAGRRAGPLPDALPTLEALRRAGYRTAVMANQPSTVDAFLASLPVDQCGSSQTSGVAEPNPAFFARVAEELALPPQRVAYVGDQVDNERAARQGRGDTTRCTCAAAPGASSTPPGRRPQQPTSGSTPWPTCPPPSPVAPLPRRAGPRRRSGARPRADQAGASAADSAGGPPGAQRLGGELLAERPATDPQVEQEAVGLADLAARRDVEDRHDRGAVEIGADGGELLLGGQLTGAASSES